MIKRNNLKRSLWASLSRTLGVGLGVGAGSVIHQLAGTALDGWGPAIFMAAVSFLLMFYSEYQKEGYPVESDASSEQLHCSCKAKQ